MAQQTHHGYDGNRKNQAEDVGADRKDVPMDVDSEFVQDVQHGMFLNSIIPSPSDGKPIADSSQAPASSQSPSSSQTPTSSQTPASSQIPRRPIIKHYQPSVQTIISYGIKVRDFAYEAQPPVMLTARARYYSHTIRSMAKRPRLGEGVNYINMTGDETKKPKPLQREATEPVIEVPSQRARGYKDIRYANFEAKIAPRTPPSTPPATSDQSHSGSQPYINTPRVSPNGSLHWVDKGNMNQVPQINIKMQRSLSACFPMSPLTPLSQVGASLGRENSPDPLLLTPSPPSRTHSTLPTFSRSATPRCPSLNSIKLSTPAPRYFLRKRGPAATASPCGLTRTLSLSRQSAHTKVQRVTRNQKALTKATSPRKPGRRRGKLT